MDIGQKALATDLSSWLEQRQSQLKIVKTTKSPTGQTLDWVPIESQAPGGKIAPPPPNHATRALVEDRTRPVKAAELEFQDAAEALLGPAGTVPIVRPDLSLVPATTKLGDFLRKQGGARVNREQRAAAGDPDPAGYFHNIDGQSGTFYGWDGYLNVWDPAINTPAAPGDDHSILQVWLQNYQKPQRQSLEGGWTVDKALNGDTQPHVFTYYTTNGYKTDGDNLGGYNAIHKGWVQYSSASTTGSVVFPGIRINNPSTYGGTQIDISMKFQLYREPNNGPLNWWVSVQGVWMGYYPASLFDGGLGNLVQWVGCGGEVDSTLAKPEQTKDQMGSGHQASAGWTKAAFLRNLRNQTDLSGTMVDNDGTAQSDVATPGGSDPYTIAMHMKSGSSWGSYFYVGGPTATATS